MPIVTVTALAADQPIVKRLLTHLAEDIAEAISWIDVLPGRAYAGGDAVR